jgi:predicted Zn-dependent protease
MEQGATARQISGLGAPDPAGVRAAAHRYGVARAFAALLAVPMACTMLGGCATETRDNGAGFLAPTAVSELYSQANLRMSLAVTPGPQACTADDCLHQAEFERRVMDMGARIAKTAYERYPELSARIQQFDFSVVDKSEPGTGSTAAGHIVVLRPVDELARSDQALSFVLAREMGHVVARHHEENTGVSIAISALTMVVAPALSLARVLASTMVSASTTVASFFGSRALVDTYRPRQQQQADAIAMELLGRMGYDRAAVASGFAAEPLSHPQGRWMEDLQVSVAHLLDAAKGQADVPEGSQPGASEPEPRPAGPTDLASSAPALQRVAVAAASLSLAP